MVDCMHAMQMTRARRKIWQRPAKMTASPLRRTPTAWQACGLSHHACKCMHASHTCLHLSSCGTFFSTSSERNSMHAYMQTLQRLGRAPAAPRSSCGACRACGAPCSTCGASAQARLAARSRPRCSAPPPRPLLARPRPTCGAPPSLRRRDSQPRAQPQSPLSSSPGRRRLQPRTAPLVRMYCCAVA
jgi:hypothetical protein